MDMKLLSQGFSRLAADYAVLAQLLLDDESPPETSMDELRSYLAEKNRTGYRAEVKALLTKYGAERLSDVTDPKIMAAIRKEAEEIGNG